MTPADPIPPPVTPEPLSEQELEAIQKQHAAIVNFHADCDDEWCRSADQVAVSKVVLRLIAQTRAARPSPWQPIETAPKDGTWIVVLAHALRDHHPVAVRWSKDVGDGESFSWNDGMDTIVGGPLSWQPIAQPAPPAQDGGRP